MKSRHACCDDRADLPGPQSVGCVLQFQEPTWSEKYRAPAAADCAAKGAWSRLVQLYRRFPSVEAMLVVRPQTLVRWRRAGFRGYWRRKSCSQGGRPPISTKLRELIRRMSQENPLWGAPRIHGELLKLGFTVSQLTVGKYMARKRGPPGQSWSTFVRNHAPQIAAMDLFVMIA